MEDFKLVVMDKLELEYLNVIIDNSLAFLDGYESAAKKQLLKKQRSPAISF